MHNNALERLVEEYRNHNDWVDSFELNYSKYTLFYAGCYYGYVYETDDPDADDNEHEYTWSSFDNMLDTPIDELGKSMREVLTETPADKIFIYF